MSDPINEPRNPHPSDEPRMAAYAKHRTSSWQVLDAMFPEQPRLWSAGEAMLMASNLLDEVPTQTQNLRSASRYIETAIEHLCEVSSQIHDEIHMATSFEDSLRDIFGKGDRPTGKTNNQTNDEKPNRPEN